MDKFAHLASFEEIVENDYNLNIPRYVDTFEEEGLVIVRRRYSGTLLILRQNQGPGQAQSEEVSERVGAIRRITWSVLKILSLMITLMCVYICLKKKGYKGQYEAVVFPNALDQKIKET